MKLFEWRMFLDALPNPVTLNRKSVDQQGTVYDTILHTNVAFQNTIGYTSEDIPTDRVWFEKAYPDKAYQAFIFIEWNKALEEARENHHNLLGFPALIKCKNSTDRWFNVSTHIDYPIEDEYKIITFLEINSPEQNRFDRDNALLQLTREKEFLQTLINMLPIRIFWKDKDLNYLGCNKVFAQDAGFSDPLQMIGKNDYDMTWRDQAQLYRNDDFRVMKMGESTLGYIEPQTTPDGKQIWLRTSKIPLVDEKTGEAFGILGTYDDITSQFLDQERLRYALSGSNDGLWDWNIDTNEIYFSPRWMNILGFEYGDNPETLDTFIDLLDPKDKDRILNLFEAYSKGSVEDFEAEFRMKHKNGTWINILSRAKLASDTQGAILEPRRLVGTHSDISSRKTMESALRKRELYQRALLDNFPYFAWLKDAHGHFLTASKPLSTMLGFENSDQMYGITDYALWSKELADSYLADDHEVMRNRKPILREEEVSKGDMHKWVETYKAPIIDEEGNVFGTVGFARDITERKTMEKQLHRMAHYDSLTHLPNRLLFSDRLHQSMAHSKRHNTNLAIVYLDLDGFKNVNDQYGHNTGDELLITIANRMKRALREGDTIARLGGDEFVLILQELDDISEIKPILERLLLSASSIVIIDNIEVSLSASIGVTFYPQTESIDADQLVRQADQAMYRAKQTGKNRYHLFDADQDRFVRIQHETIERIRKALNQDEFTLYYQPKVNMRTGEVIGAEALIRWNHPEKGILSPAAFLPDIQNHRLMVEIGAWVLETAVKQIDQWQKQKIFFPLSVNVDSMQLQEDGFVDSVQNLLRRYPNIRKESLEFEILETSALEDVSTVAYVISRCAEFGISFALDDFGTGYSSLTYLKRLPVKILKIDQSFVFDLLDDPEDLAIVEGIRELANTFGREIIAEGVESVLHGLVLMLIGCDKAQGYFISKPLPVNKFNEWLSEWKNPEEWENHLEYSSENLLLAYTIAEHRTWIKQVCDFLKEGNDNTPLLNPSECSIGKWLKQIGNKFAENKENFKKLIELHNDIHTEADSAMHNYMNGKVESIDKSIENLIQQCDLMTNLLLHLGQK